MIVMIWQSTATAMLPVVMPCSSDPLQAFDSVTNSEIQSLLATVPATYSSLDPIPTWLLKELALNMVPVIWHSLISYCSEASISLTVCLRIQLYIQISLNLTD